MGYRLYHPLVVILVLAVHGGNAVSYPCVTTSTCVKAFMLKIWKSDIDFFLLSITADDFKTNCTEAQKCLSDLTGGGTTSVDDVTLAALAFIYDVCSQDRQQKFDMTMGTCVLKDVVREKAKIFHENWLTTRDSTLAAIASQGQVPTFCSILSDYVSNLQDTFKVGGCTDGPSLDWCMKIVHEKYYEEYGAFCPCIGNCDCRSTKSSSPVLKQNGSGAGYMMVVFGLIFLIAAFIVRRSKQRK